MITIELHYLNKTTFTSRLQKWLGSVELAIADETYSYVELESSCDFNLSKTNFKNERTKMRASKSLPQFNSFKEEFSLQSPSTDKPYSIVIVGIKYSSTSHKQQQECEKILQKVITLEAHPATTSWRWESPRERGFKTINCFVSPEPEEWRGR